MAEQNQTTEPTTLTLERIREIAQSYKMTPDERREQRISYVYGVLSHRSTLTREDVRRIMEEQGYA